MEDWGTGMKIKNEVLYRSNWYIIEQYSKSRSLIGELKRLIFRKWNCMCETEGEEDSGDMHAVAGIVPSSTIVKDIDGGGGPR